MSATTSNLDVESLKVRAVVTRADGSTEDLGVVASYRRPWYKTVLVKFLRVIGKA